MGVVCHIAVHWESEYLGTDYKECVEIVCTEELPGSFSVFAVCVRAYQFCYSEVLFEGGDDFSSVHCCCVF